MGLGVKGKNDIIEQARKIIAFRFMSDGEILSLLGDADVLRFGVGDTILEQGDASPYFYGVLDGSVAIAAGEDSGKRVYINTLGPGDVFGEAGLFMNVKRTASVSAVSESSVMRVNRTALVRFMKTDPEAGNKVLLVIIYSLLRKLAMVNQELAHERKNDMDQDGVDSILQTFFGDKADS